jgi:hypothetical protein
MSGNGLKRKLKRWGNFDMMKIIVGALIAGLLTPIARGCGNLVLWIIIAIIFMILFSYSR